MKRFDILFTGDCFVQSKDNRTPFLKGITGLMLESSNVCVNLETTVGVGGTKVPKAVNFQISPDNLNYLKDNGSIIASVANNHSMDYGEEGFLKTLENLNNNGLSIIGATDNNVKLFKLGGVSYCVSSYYGGGGVISACKENNILDNILKYRSTSDIIIVCLHWGEEYSAYPKPKQQLLARKLIDNGVDVIIGHHPHVPQGMEEYNGKPIFYSLGNFNFNVQHPYHDKLITTKYGYCVGISHDANGKMKYDIIPIHINENWQPEIITEANEIERFINYFSSISKPLSKGVSSIFYYSHSSIHIFRNYYPSWKKQIREQGLKQVIDMARWHIKPSTFAYYAGLLLYPFTKHKVF